MYGYKCLITPGRLRRTAEVAAVRRLLEARCGRPCQIRRYRVVCCYNGEYRLWRVATVSWVVVVVVVKGSGEKNFGAWLGSGLGRMRGGREQGRSCRPAFLLLLLLLLPSPLLGLDRDGSQTVPTSSTMYYSTRQVCYSLGTWTIQYAQSSSSRYSRQSTKNAWRPAYDWPSVVGVCTGTGRVGTTQLAIMSCTPACTGTTHQGASLVGSM